MNAMNNLFHSKNKTILYVILSPTSYLMLGYHDGENSGQMNITFEINNSTAVELIKKNVENSPAIQKELDERLKMILKKVVKLTYGQGLRVPGMDQMKDYFKI
jgi:hypothetical protein